MPEKQNYDFRKYFLKNFVENLIKNSFIPTQEQETKSEMAQEKEDYQPSIISPPPNITKEIQTLPPMPSPKPIVLPPLTPINKFDQPKKVGSINFGKVTSFLLDPTVISVECPGPGKNLLINKIGLKQSSSITLSEEEIKSIMEEISQKTRIPINRGLFRAAIQDLLVTAVVSEYVGTRFIIQKRKPF